MRFRVTFVLGLLLALLAQSPVHAQLSINSTPHVTGLHPMSYEVVTFDATAAGIGLSAATLTVDNKQARVCFGVLETAAIRIRYDGERTAANVLDPPTATDGVPIAVGQWIYLEGFAALTQLRGIRTTATSGVIRFVCAR